MKDTIKFLVFTVIIMSTNSIFAMSASKPDSKSLTLFDDGKTEYKIVVAANAPDSEQFAAAELAKYLKQISGADFEIVSQTSEISKKSIFVGFGSINPPLRCPVPTADDESFKIFTKDGNLYIYGGADRGTLYGVYTFLEYVFDCRWYTSKVTVIPRCKTGNIMIDMSFSPLVRFRAVDYIDMWNHELAVPNKVNTQFHGPQSSPYIEQLWLEHSFDVFVPVAEFFDTHPEYFSLIDGQRKKEIIRPDGRKIGTQLCLTNPDVLKITIERLRKYIKEHPQYTIYNVAQNDNQSPCLCDECQAIVQTEGAESGPMLWFVNQVADAIKDEFPDKYIGTFAYQYTRKPPINIKPAENVMIILCSIECDFSHSFHHPHNIKFLEDLRNWQAKTKNILIWDYVINYRYYFLPHPNFNILEENIDILYGAGVQAILEQANGQSIGSEFYGLRAWVLSKLLWGTPKGTRVLVEDYINGYYQNSAPHILTYFDLVQSLPTDDSYITYATRLTNPIFTPKFLKKSNELFDMAEAAADNEEILRRVEIARLPILFMNITTDLFETDKHSDLEKLIKITDREGIIWSSEGMKTADMIKKVSEKLAEQQ